MFDQFIDLIPEEKRDEFKAIASKAVNLDEILSSEEKVRELTSKDQIRKMMQSETDRRVADQEKKFIAEKLPKILDEERAKGAKKDWEIKIEELEKRSAQQARENAIEKQRTRAITIATEKGIPLAVIARYIGETEEETDSALNPVIDVLTKWKESAVTDALKKIGAQPKPTAGTDSKAMSITDFRKLSATEQSKYMLTGGTLTE